MSRLRYSTQVRIGEALRYCHRLATGPLNRRETMIVLTWSQLQVIGVVLATTTMSEHRGTVESEWFAAVFGVLAQAHLGMKR